MKKYKITMYEEQGGVDYIEAVNEEEARKLAQDMLSAEGIDAFKGFNIKHRDFAVVDVEEA